MIGLWEGCVDHDMDDRLQEPIELKCCPVNFFNAVFCFCRC
jgi:hypothetical protein